MLNTTSSDPLKNPEWQALARECGLVSQLLGSGVTALGKANYADGKGNYYVAFFGLSVGMERLAKLILVADYALQNSGRLPQEKEIKRFGHKIVTLLEKVNEISHQHRLSLSYSRPTDQISQAIVDCLDSFADAGLGRYANFQALGDPNFNKEFEPITKWWKNVAEVILEKHYYGTSREKKVTRNAAVINQLIGNISSVLYHNETGEVMQDIQTASTRTGQTNMIQSYGRYYTLRIVRWMADVFDKLTHTACHGHGIDVLFGHYEHFNSYCVDDSFLKTRKHWPLV
jgi:hypothetical protein